MKQSCHKTKTICVSFRFGITASKMLSRCFYFLLPPPPMANICAILMKMLMVSW